MKLVIETQTFENYGAHAWNGTGACPQQWKPKGMAEYVFPVSLDQHLRGDEILRGRDQQEIVDLARLACTRADDYWRETVVGFYWLQDTEPTHSEHQQLANTGTITYPSPVRSFAAITSTIAESNAAGGYRPTTTGKSRARTYQFTLPVHHGQIQDIVVYGSTERGAAGYTVYSNSLVKLRARFKELNRDRSLRHVLASCFWPPAGVPDNHRYVIELKYRGPRMGNRYRTPREFANAVDVYVYHRPDGR